MNGSRVAWTAVACVAGSLLIVMIAFSKNVLLGGNQCGSCRGFVSEAPPALPSNASQVEVAHSPRTATEWKIMSAQVPPRGASVRAYVPEQEPSSYTREHRQEAPSSYTREHRQEPPSSYVPEREALSDRPQKGLPRDHLVIEPLPRPEVEVVDSFADVTRGVDELRSTSRSVDLQERLPKAVDHLRWTSQSVDASRRPSELVEHELESASHRPRRSSASETGQGVVSVDAIPVYVHGQSASTGVADVLWERSLESRTRERA